MIDETNSESISGGNTSQDESNIQGLQPTKRRIGLPNRAIAIVLALLVLITPAEASPAQGISSPVCGAWNIVSEIDTKLSPFSGRFYDVAAISNDDVWMAGNS